MPKLVNGELNCFCVRETEHSYALGTKQAYNDHVSVPSCVICEICALPPVRF